MGRDFVIGHYYPDHYSFKINMYKIARNGAVKYANSINRELAEGPTVLITDNLYGPVELWPLVIEEGEGDALSG
jgi:hypothetical protein